jgi:hypothetical protein
MCVSVFRVLLGAWFFLLHVPGAYAVESNFWQDRRSYSFKSPKSPQPLLASLPSSLVSPPGEFVPGRVSPPPPFSGPSGRSFRSSFGSKPFSLEKSKKIDWITSSLGSYGDLREVFLSSDPKAPLVVHVQDVHDIEEAQRNIAGLLGGFQREGGVDFVGLEGAVGPFELGPYRASPDSDVTKTLADAFLGLGYLTGPEVAAITSAQAPFLWGVEDLGLYGEHIRAFQESERLRPTVQGILNQWSSALKEAQDRFYSKELLILDNHRKAFDSNRESLTDFVHHLWTVGTFNEKSFPHIARLLQAMAWEKNIDFKRVEKERMSLVNEISRTVPESVLDVLVQKSVDYRSGSLSYGDYFQFLLHFCHVHGISMAPYPSFNDYISYVRLAEEIKREEFLDELESLNRAADSFLATTPEQKFLVAASQVLGRLEKLMSHQLSPSEWAHHQKDRKFMGEIPGKISFLLGRSQERLSPLPREVLAPFENFCERALDRDKALVENFLIKMKAEGLSSGILVAGGFHTEGMVHLLRQKGVSFAVVTPRFSVASESSPPPLDVFSRQPRPLEKLLAGDVIHLNFPLHTQAGSEALGLVSNGMVPGANGFVRQETSQILWSSLRVFLEKLKRGFHGVDLDNFQTFANGFRAIIGVSSRVLEFKGRYAMAVKVRNMNGTEREFLLVSEPQGTAYGVDLPENPVYQGPFLLDDISTRVSVYDFRRFGPMDLGPVSWAREAIPAFWISNGRAIRRFVPRLLGGLLNPPLQARAEARMEEAHDAFIQRAAAQGISRVILNGIAAHMRRSRELANRISRDLNLSSTDRNDLRLAATIHDTGKFHPDCVNSIASRLIYGSGSEAQKDLQKHESVVFQMMAQENLPLTEEVALILKVHSALGPRSEEKWEDIEGVTERHIRLALLLAMIDVSDGYRDMHRPYIQTRVIYNKEGFPSLGQLQSEFRRYSNQLRKSDRRIGYDLSEWADRKFDDLLKKTWFRIATEKTLFEFIALKVSPLDVSGSRPFSEDSFKELLSSIKEFDLFSRDTPLDLWWPSLVESLWLQGKGVSEREETLTRLVGLLEGAIESLTPPRSHDLRALTLSMMSLSFRGTYDLNSQSSELIDHLEALFQDHRYLDFDKLGWALSSFVVEGKRDSKPGSLVTVTARQLDGTVVLKMEGDAIDAHPGRLPTGSKKFVLSERNFKGRETLTARLNSPSFSSDQFSLNLVVPYSSDHFAPWHVTSQDIATLGEWLERMFERGDIEFLNVHLTSNRSLPGPIKVVRYQGQTTIYLNPDRLTKTTLEKAIAQLVAGVPALRSGGPVFDRFSQMTLTHLGIKPTRFNSLLNMFVGHGAQRIKERPWLHLGGAVIFENILRVAYIAGFYSLAVGAGAGPLMAFYAAYIGGGVILWALSHKFMNLFLRWFFPQKKIQMLTWTDALYKIPASFLVSILFLSVGFYFPLENVTVDNQVMALLSSPLFMGAVGITTLFQAGWDASIVWSRPSWGRHLLNMFLEKSKPEIIPPAGPLIFTTNVNDVQQAVLLEREANGIRRQEVEMTPRARGLSLAEKHRKGNVPRQQRVNDLRALFLEVGASVDSGLMELVDALRSTGEGYNRELGIYSLSEAVEAGIPIGIEVSVSLLNSGPQHTLDPRDLATLDQLRQVAQASQQRETSLTLIAPTDVLRADVSSFLERHGMGDLKFFLVSKTSDLLNAVEKYSVRKLMMKAQGVSEVSALRPMTLFFHDLNQWAMDARLAQILSLLEGDLYYDVQRLTEDQLKEVVAMRIQA